MFMATSEIKAEKSLEVGLVPREVYVGWQNIQMILKKELLFAFMPPILKPEILHSCENLFKSQKQSTEYVTSGFDSEGLRNGNTMAP